MQKKIVIKGTQSPYEKIAELPAVLAGFAMMRVGLVAAYPKLAKKIHDVLPHHNIHHALNVAKDALTIALVGDMLTDREEELLMVASAFHDTGFARQYEENENYGAEFAEIYMRRLRYTEEDIAAVREAIMGTRVKFNPFRQLVSHDKMSQILADADVANFGKTTHERTTDNVFFELLLVGKIPANTPENRRKFDESRLKMLTEHRWQTDAARILFEKRKLINIEELRKYLRKSDATRSRA